jgi:hypothetical protein
MKIILTNRLAKNENLSNGWTKKIQLPHNHGHLLAHEKNNYQITIIKTNFIN